MLESMQSLAENLADPSSQRAAFTFLGRCVSIWGQLGPAGDASNGNGESSSLPGFERFVYERLVPVAFGVLSSPQFTLKDPQMMAVSIVPLLWSTSYSRLFVDYRLSTKLPTFYTPLLALGDKKPQNSFSLCIFLRSTGPQKQLWSSRPSYEI